MVYGSVRPRLSEGCALRREDIDPKGKEGEENIVPVEDAVVSMIQSGRSLMTPPGSSQEEVVAT